MRSFKRDREVLPLRLLVKYDKNFKIEWIKVNSFALQGNSEYNYSVKQTSQGNYISVVSSSSNPYKLVEYDSNGNVKLTI